MKKTFLFLFVFTLFGCSFPSKSPVEEIVYKAENFYTEESEEKKGVVLRSLDNPEFKNVLTTKNVVDVIIQNGVLTFVELAKDQERVLSFPLEPIAEALNNKKEKSELKEKIQ